jgi:F-type H+-transporting ATPase subunit alpha
MRSVAGNLRLNLAQYRELEAFAAFGSDLDKASKSALERGSRLVELLKQPQYQPQAVERQVVSIWTGTTGQLDEVPVEDIRRFEAEFLDYIATSLADIFNVIRESKVLSDDTVAALTKAIDSFKSQFTTSSGEQLVKDVPVEALEEQEIDPTQITKKVK